MIGDSYFYSPPPKAKENRSGKVYERWAEKDKTLVFDKYDL